MVYIIVIKSANKRLAMENISRYPNNVGTLRCNRQNNFAR